MLLMPVQPPISTIPCKILYLLANPVLPFPVFSSPAASPTNRSRGPRPPHSNPCHPEHSEGSCLVRPLAPIAPFEQSLLCRRPFLLAVGCELSTVNCHPSQITKSFTFRTYAKRTRNSRRIRTSKTQHLKPFRMNTYKKTGRGAPVAHTSNCALSLPLYLVTSLRRSFTGQTFD